jgi:hypothetical protein
VLDVIRLLATSVVLGMALALPASVVAQSEPPPTSPSPPPASLTPGAIPVVGPDGTGVPPSPPIGPEWQVPIERDMDVLRMRLVACDGGFAFLAYGNDARGRPRSEVWRSDSGLEWSRGEDIRPRGDPIRDPWSVFELVVVDGELLALGGEDRRLVVWRSPDCGASWRRLADRPVFRLGREAIGLTSVDAAATTDTLVVIGLQGGEELPRGRWAWTLGPDRVWRRIPGGLEASVDFGLASDGRVFSAVRLQVLPDDFAESWWVTSPDGRTWTDVAILPERMPPVPDPTRERYLLESQAAEPGNRPQILASTDGSRWSPMVTARELTPSSPTTLFTDGGVLVWVADVIDRTDDNPWSWIGVSEDGGETWSVSAGWPGMALAGLVSMAVSDTAVALAVTGDGFDGFRVLVLPRASAPAEGLEAAERPTR